MSFNVTILGSSSAIPTSNRYLTAHLVNHDERFFLIDCGEGTQMQLRRFNTKYSRINHIFISHLHGDHVFGLIGFISSLSMMGRKNDLHIFAHQQLDDIMHTNFKFFNIELSYKLIFHALSHKTSEIIYNDSKLEIKSIPLKHRIPCVGFVFTEKPKAYNVRKFAIEEYGLGVKEIVAAKQGLDIELADGRVIKNQQITQPPLPSKKYVFCTDTKYSENIIDQVMNADVLYHESTFLETDKRLAKDTYHSTALQAATIARKANAKKLILGHFSSRYKNEQLFLNEAQPIFEHTYLAVDGMCIEI